jgi:hypothetical protein
VRDSIGTLGKIDSKSETQNTNLLRYLDLADRAWSSAMANKAPPIYHRDFELTRLAISISSVKQNVWNPRITSNRPRMAG